MSKKNGGNAELIEQFRGRDFDAHYLGYFGCFNRRLYVESHDVLEELWLADRQGPNYSFYKGLIQFAGAFVHLQKNRLRPSAALFKLAQANLQKYPPIHDHLDVAGMLRVIEQWLQPLENNAKLLRLLRAMPSGRRTARFRCVLALTPVTELSLENASPVCAANEFELQTELFDGACEGEISLSPSGQGGFGYDPLFVPAS